MSISIRRGIYTYYFVPLGSALSKPDENVRQQDFAFSSTTEAVAFLRRLGSDTLTVPVFRRVVRTAGVNNPADYQDAEIMELVARELVRKRLTVLARYRIEESSNTDRQEEAAPARSSSSAGPKSSEPDPDTFRDPDGDQQAAALSAASQSGAPFCEECARADQQQQQPQPSA